MSSSLVNTETNCSSKVFTFIWLSEYVTSFFAPYGARTPVLSVLSVFLLLMKLHSFYITKTYLCNFDPLKPHFYIVKLGFTGVYIIFLISDQNIDCGYSLEPPRRGGSNEYPQSMFWAEIWKISEFFYLKTFQFLEVKFSIYLNRRVFVMGFSVESGSTISLGYWL